MLSKKKFLVSVALLFFSAAAFSVPALTVRDEAMGKDSVQDSIEYILSHISDADTSSGKRSLWCLAGSLQDLSGDWTGASRSYLQAAKISGENESGFESYSADRLRLSAARCFLNFCDFDNAESVLGSIKNSSKDEKITAMVNLYSVWVSLCQIKSPLEIGDPLDRLKSYLEMDSMKSVMSSVLFTLWYISGDRSYSDRLKKEFPLSVEYSIVQGKSVLSAAPFWYFVPRSVDEEALHYSSADSKTAEKKSTATQKSDVKSAKKENAPADTKKSVSSSSKKSDAGTKNTEESLKAENKSKLTREQLGLFRSKNNAESLISRLKDKGFEAYYFTETRASGTTYYIVVVDENMDGTMGKRLRAAGFDCYPVE